MQNPSKMPGDWEHKKEKQLEILRSGLLTFILGIANCLYYAQVKQAAAFQKKSSSWVTVYTHDCLEF